jgi:hypothetical protein
VRAVKGKGLSAPALADNLHALFEQRHPVLHGDAKRPEVSGLVADSHAQNDAPFGDNIQCDHVLRHVHRVMEWQKHDRGSDVQAACLGRHRRGHNQRRRQEAVFILMVLAKEAGIKTARLGKLGFGNGFVDTAIQMLPAWWVGNRAINTEFHACPPCWLRRSALPPRT